VTIVNVPVFDKRSTAVTGFEPIGGATISISGPHGLSHVAEVTVAFAGALRRGHTIPGMLLHREDACTALNYLVDVYRSATNDYRIRHVMPDYDVTSLTSEIVTEKGTEPDGILAAAPSSSPYPVRIRDLSEPKTRRYFEALLQGESGILASREYLQEARHFFHERDFKVAVILGSTALEVGWAELLEAGMEQQVIDQEERKKRLNKYTTPTATKGTLTRLDQGLLEVFNRSLEREQPELFAAVNGPARDLRKNVIHPKVKVPTQQETLTALVVIERTMQWLREQIIPMIIDGSDSGQDPDGI
jgi:hypothetical protein